MALEGGGYAEKLGNRYEGLWVAEQLVLLLQEQILSISLERVGDDEEGVDLWIELINGKREAQQCKSSCGKASKWTVSRLGRKGILDYLQSQLKRNPNYQYAIVSPLHGGLVNDLARSARDSSENPEEWYNYQVLGRSSGHSDAFKEFCRQLRLNNEVQSERGIAFDFLKRTYFYLFNDDPAKRREIRSRISLLLEGDVDLIPIMVDVAEENLRRTITSDIFVQELENRGIKHLTLEKDKRLLVRLEELRVLFKSYVGKRLAAGTLIEREETRKVVEELQSEDRQRLILVHGAAGSGKSGVLYELCGHLEKENIPYLPIRLDVFPPEPNIRTYSTSLNLPDDPVRCLLTAAGDETAVLILDQVDSLRSLGLQSITNWDVFTSLVNRAIQSRQIRVIASCRSFDLQHDPHISKWEREVKLDEIQVGILPEVDVKQLVENVGGNYDSLEPKERNLLRTIQNLTIWLDIWSTSGTTSHFTTSIELFQQYWRNLYQELENRGIPQSEAMTVLHSLVDSMDSNSRTFAPKLLLLGHQRITAELLSLGVIQIQEDRVSFSHQTFLDFLTAQKLLSAVIDDVGTLNRWLDLRQNQTLIRRYQIQLILALMRTEDRSRYLKELRLLIRSTAIRFHIKIAALQFLGIIEDPIEEEMNFVKDLLLNANWREHVIDQTIFSNVQWFKILNGKGIWTGFLDTEDEEQIESALRVLYSVNQVCGDILAHLLTPYIEKSKQWTQRALRVLPFDASEDSDELFELRLKLYDEGNRSDFFDWNKLSRNNPLRCIRLVELNILNWINIELAGESKTPLRKFGPNSRLGTTWDHDSSAFIRAAESEPHETWDRLFPFLKRIIDINSGIEVDTKSETSITGLKGSPITRRLRIPKFLIELLTAAGRTLASQYSSAFKDLANELMGYPHIEIQRLLLFSMSTCPEELSDWVIQWFIDDSNRLSVGDEFQDPAEKPASELISRFAIYCSLEIYNELESILLSYHPPEEFDSIRYRHEQGRFRDQFPSNLFGKAQYFLLPSLPLERASNYVLELISVLRRKYEDRKFSHQWRGEGGWVTSPIPKEKLSYVSDELWLSIVQQYNESCDSTEWRQIDKDTVGEASIENFAYDLSLVTAKEPKRFVDLALRFPPGTDPQYFKAILRGLRTKEPPGDLEEDLKKTWVPASAADIEGILELISNYEDTVTAVEICQLVEARAEANWTTCVILKIVEYATGHPHSDVPGKIITAQIMEEDEDEDVGPLDSLEIAVHNTVKGSAGSAIRALLFEHIEIAEIVTPAIRSLIEDPNIAIRTAGIMACGPMLNVNKDLAVELFIKACDTPDDSILCTRSVVRFLVWASSSHFKQIRPIIRRMCRSKFKKAKYLGAEQVALQWIMYNRMRLSVIIYSMGSISSRRGVAAIASQLITDTRYSTDKCKRLLLRFFNDKNEKVREAAGDALRKSDLLSYDGIEEIVEGFVKSQAFLDDQTWIMNALRTYTGSLIPWSGLILEVAATFGSTLAEEARLGGTRVASDSRELLPLLIRLYEEAKAENQTDTLNKCLDAWDSLLLARVAGSVKLIHEIEGIEEL